MATSRSQVRKKLSIAHAARDPLSVTITVSEFIGLLRPIGEVVALFEQLSSASSLEQQTRLIQGRRKAITNSLMGTNDQQHIDDSVALLFRLYLGPEYFALQTAMEWLVQCTKDLSALSLSVVSNVHDVCRLKFGEAKRLLLTNLHDWLPTLRVLCTLEREFGWMRMSEDDLLESLRLILMGLQQCPLWQGQKDDCDALTATEMVRWEAASSDLLRCLVMLLRLHSPLITQSSQTTSRWIDVCHQLQLIALTSLQQCSQLRDVMTGAGAAFALLYIAQRTSDQNQGDNIASIKSLIAAIREDGVVGEGSELSSVAVCAITRGALSTYGPAILEEDVDGWLLQQGLDIIVSVCRGTEASSQIFGLQSLDVWMTQFSALNGPALSSQALPVLHSCFLTACDLLCLNWSHPARQVNHLIPSIYEKLLRSIYRIQQLTPSFSSTGLWSKIAERLFLMPSYHRGKYQAMKLVMDVLGVEALLSLKPDIVHVLITMLQERDVAAAVSALLSRIIHLWSKQEDAMGNLDSILRALCSQDQRRRLNVGEFLLPDLCRGNPVLLKTLLHRLHILFGEHMHRAEVMWGMIQLLLQSGCVDLTGQEDWVVDMMERAALSEVDEVRLAAVSLPFIVRKTVTPLSTISFQVAQRTWSYGLKTAHADVNVKYSVALRGMLKKSDHTDAEVSRQQVLQWLLSMVQQAVYPGVPVDREYAMLNLLHTAVDYLAEAQSHDADRQRGDWFDGSLVQLVLVSMESRWDRTRQLCSEILCRLPRPWYGHMNNSECLRRVFERGCSLASSSRLREYDAGARILCCLFECYGWDTDFSSTIVWNKQSGSASSALFAFLLQRCVGSLGLLQDYFQQFVRVCLVRKVETEGGFDEQVNADLLNAQPIHGYLLTMRLCIQRSEHFKALVDYEGKRWNEAVSQLARVSLQAMEVAMLVVAESVSDNPLNGVEQASFGPVNSASYSMAASYINTNSFTTVKEVEEDEGDGMSGGQLAVVAAWLMVKEAVAVLASIVELLIHYDGDDVQVFVVDESLVRTIGSAVLQALGRLKHMGAIGEAHSALQRIVYVLIRCSSTKTRSLTLLPCQWLESLLMRLVKHEQVFILRRSAGFAYSFLSILRSEPANATPVLLHQSMDSLLRLVDKTVSATSIGNEPWKLSVHAFNVLKLIILDAAFGIELDGYCSQVFVLAMRGFLSSIWAVRNSSMMVFSAAVQKFVSRDKNERAKAATSSAMDFFQRHDTLLPFLIDYITASVRAASRQQVLLPCLLLLAKFKPVWTPNVFRKEYESLTSSVESCFACPSMNVREMASRAMMSLRPAVDIPDEIGRNIRLLVTGCEGLNEKQARLLYLIVMLQHVQSLNYRGESDEALGYAMQLHLKLRDFLLNDPTTMMLRLADVIVASGCSVLSHYFIRFLQLYESCVGTSEPGLQRIEFISQFVAMAHNSLLSGEAGDEMLALPFAPLLAEQVATISTRRLLKGLLGGIKTKFAGDIEVFKAWMNHRVIEVRRGTLQGIRLQFEVLSQAQYQAQSRKIISELVTLLEERVKVEADPHLLSEVLMLLQQIIAHDQSEADPRLIDVADALAAQLLSKLDHIVPSTSNLTVYSIAPFTYQAIQIIALTMARRSSNTDQTQLSPQWLSCCQRLFLESMPTEARIAVTNSLLASQLHQQIATVASAPSSSLLPQILVHITEWTLLLVELLQDEDEEVRKAANGCCSSLLGLVAPTQSGDGSSTVSMYTLHQMDRVLALLLSQAEMIESIEAVDIVWTRWVVAMGDATEVDCHGSKQIFTMEEWNTYKEEVLYLDMLAEAFTLALTRSHTQWLFCLIVDRVNSVIRMNIERRNTSLRFNYLYGLLKAIQCLTNISRPQQHLVIDCWRSYILELWQQYIPRAMRYTRISEVMLEVKQHLHL